MLGRRLLILSVLAPAAVALDTFAHPSGRDGAAGTAAAPQSLAACVEAVKQPGDRCLLQAGVYPVTEAVRVDGKAGTPSARVAIAGAGDGPVVLDGTADVSTLAKEEESSAGDAGCERALEEACGAQKGGVFACAECAGVNLQALSAAGCGNDAISAWCAGVPLTKSTWRPAPEVGPHVYALSLAPGAGITQLFAGHASAHDDTLQMLVPARWPNARWDDKTMFEGPEHWAHAGPAGDGAEHNVSTMVGLLYDYGACRSNETCCGYCNNNSLAASGVNATGAVMIMNLWGNGCGVQTVDQHTPGTNLLRYTATWCKAEIESKHGKCADGYRGGRGRYYLEASRALLDAPSGKLRHLFCCFQAFQALLFSSL